MIIKILVQEKYLGGCLMYCKNHQNVRFVTVSITRVTTVSEGHRVGSAVVLSMQSIMVHWYRPFKYRYAFPSVKYIPLCDHPTMGALTPCKASLLTWLVINKRVPDVH
jgi:hypothetical protein